MHMSIKLLNALALLTLSLLPACTSYDEVPETVHVRVQLVYPSNSEIGPYEGARVELTNANASTFVDSTDAAGVATFDVPGGIYSAVSSEVYLDTVSAVHYRYIFNGRIDQRVISPDSASNDITISLTMTRRRYWN
jgi:hypothetical protein